MRLAPLAPTAWRSAPRHCGPREQVVANLTDGLVMLGIGVSLQPTGDSEPGPSFDRLSSEATGRTVPTTSRCLRCRTSPESSKRSTSSTSFTTSLPSCGASSKWRSARLIAAAASLTSP